MSTPLAVIETDAYCDKCGFNLRSRPVTRDERLGLLICQCPECGAFQSATGRATALSPWLNRLALLAAIAWVGVSVAFALALMASLLAVDVAAVETLTYRALSLADGREVNLVGVGNGTTGFVLSADRATPGVDAIDPSLVRMRAHLQPWLGGPAIDPSSIYRYRYFEPLEAGLAAGFMGIGLFAAFCILSAACWFWRPGRRWIWLATPLLSAAIAYAVLFGGTDWSTQHFVNGRMIQVPAENSPRQAVLAGVVPLQIAVAGLGLAFGRPITRGLLLVFCPPGLRQLFAFLWHCDGKAMPRAVSVPRTVP